VNEVNELLKAFDYQGAQIRTVIRDGEPWFVAKDVCELLELGNIAMTLERLNDDEKGVNTIDTLGGPQSMNIVDESGLYRLIFTSRKEEAELFRRWVAHEVLPAIRKTGSYFLDPKEALKQKKVEVEIWNAKIKGAKLLMNAANQQQDALSLEIIQEMIAEARELLTDKTVKRVRIIDHCGWQDDGTFALGTKIIKPSK
jgi:prophage antirepressor-like protein